MGLELVEGAADSPDKGSDAKGTTFEIVVNGKREVFDLTNPEEVDRLRQRAQMGTNYSQRVADVNRREAELQSTYDPYVQFDKALKDDPALEAVVRARLRGDPLPLEKLGAKPAAAGNGAEDGNGNGNDDRPNVAEIEARLRRDMDAKFGRTHSLLERMDARLAARDQQEAERDDIGRIKGHPVFKGWVKDDHITLAKEAQQRRGGSVYANFLLLFEHEIPRIVEGRTLNEIPAELRRTALTRDTAPLVVDGMTITEETLAEIRKDPDRYAKYKQAIRNHKRKVRGLIEYPR